MPVYSAAHFITQCFPPIMTMTTPRSYAPEASLGLSWHGTLKQNEAQSARAESANKVVPLAEFMYLVFTRMPGESCRRRLGSLLLYLCYVFRAQINSLVGWFIDNGVSAPLSIDSINIYTEKYSFSLNWARVGAATLIPALTVKGRRKLARDVLEAFATHADLVYDVTDWSSWDDPVWLTSNSNY